MENRSELNILCLGRGWGPCFGVRVFRRDGMCVYEDCLCPGEMGTMILPEGEYMVRVRNFVGLEPGGFTRWVRLKPGEKQLVQAVFRRPGWTQRRLRFTVADANYPGIVPMNGGITVWQYRTM